MDGQKYNIRILFTVKANSALDGIMKNFNLEGTLEESVKRMQGGKLSKAVVIDHLAKDFARGAMAEKDLINSLQKDLGVSSQTAQQISKEVIIKIVPFLEKVPEEKLNDPVFVGELAKKIFGETAQKNPSTDSIDDTKGIEKESTGFFPKIKSPIGVAEIIEKNTLVVEIPVGKPRKRINKPAAPEKIKDPAPQIKQTSGPDSYREPIE